MFLSYPALSRFRMYRSDASRLVCGIALLACLHGFAQTPNADAPVELGGKVVFRIQNRLASFSPQERATAVSSRLQLLAEDEEIPASEIRLVPFPEQIDIVVRDRVIFSLLAAEFPGDSSVRLQRATEIQSAIKSAIRDYRDRNRPNNQIRRFAFSALFTLVFLLSCVAAIRLVQSLAHRTLESFSTSKWGQLADKVLGPGLFTSIRRALWSAVLILLILALFQLYALAVATQFPAARGWLRSVFERTQAPFESLLEQFFAQIPNLVIIALIAVGAWLLIRLMSLIFNAIGNGSLELPGFYPDWAEPTYRIAVLFAIAAAAVVAFPYIPGSNSPAFQGLSILTGLVFSLGSGSFIANALAGTILIYMRPFQVGDRVKIAETMGDIIEKNLLVTRIRTVKQEEITIANSLILNSHVVNFTNAAARNGLILYAEVTIGYDAPWRKVHEILLEAARRTTDVATEPSPFVLQTSLCDSYVQYQINVFTKHPSRMTYIYSELRANMQDSFNEGGVEILSPSYHAVRDGNHNTIPLSYLSDQYEAPAFRIVESKR